MDTDHLLALLERTLGRHDASSATPDSTQDDGLRELVSQFLSGLPGRQHTMHQALRAQDVATLRSEAHQIKGTAGAMGYPAMTRQAGALEANLKTDDPDWERIRSDLAGLDEMIGRALASREERT